LVRDIYTNGLDLLCVYFLQKKGGMTLNGNVKKQFGLVLKRWRKKTGISQEELAWRANLHRTYVSDLERGNRNPSLESIEKLASAMNLSLSALFQPLEDNPAVPGTMSVDK